MFEKLLSQLPYNPGLAHQVSFYSRRMREEASIRRIGTVFMVLAFLVQFFAVLSPPQPTVASSSNDLINGGISSAANAAQHCNNNTQHYKNILENYGITCQQVANASTVNINSDGQNYYSFGRNAQGFNSEQPVNIPNLGTIYVRKLSAWGHNVTYRALQLTASSGKTFWIIYDCANLVSIGVPSPYSPPSGPTGVSNAQAASTPQAAPTSSAAAPTAAASSPLPTPTPVPRPPANCQQYISSANPTACLAIRKVAANTTQGIADANNSTARAGDVIVYTLYAENTARKAVKDYVFRENMNDVLDYAEVTDLHGGTMSSDNTVSWPAQDIGGRTTATVKITVKVKNPVPQTPVSSSDPTRFNLIMTNVYGNAVNINLPGSPGKTVEAAGSSLPNTGPGTSLFISGIILVAAGYFYSRSRLLARESNLALQESTA
jgi:hypothetical protein